MAKYQITVDEKQLDTLIKSTEAFSRICTGQIKYALEEGWSKKLFDLSSDTREMIEQKCRVITLLLSEGRFDGYGGSFGIYSKEINECAVTAYNIQQVLRNQKWGEKSESEKHDSRYTTSSSVSICNGEEPIKIERIE